jgi:hypothetical protein
MLSEGTNGSSGEGSSTGSTKKRKRGRPTVTFKVFADRLKSGHYKSKKQARLSVFRSKGWAKADENTALKMIDDQFQEAPIKTKQAKPASVARRLRKQRAKAREGKGTRHRPKSARKLRTQTKVAPLVQQVATAVVGDEQSAKTAKFLCSLVLRGMSAKDRERVEALITLKAKFGIQDEKFVEVMRS